MTTLDGDSAAALLDALPEFGGRAYGLEPLFLPLHPGRDEGGGGTDPAARYPELWGTGTGRAPSGGPVGPGVPTSAEQLFWFRWITGHQLTFLFWQELRRRAGEVPTAPDGPGGLPSAARLVRGYSAMLLYTASCTRDVYHRLIRPGMVRYHPGFAGSWARDYGHVRALLRGRLPTAWGGRADTLLRECTLHDAVHEGIARKLVPGAPSLLQASAGSGRILPREVRAVLYDTYFLTLRAPCSRSDVTSQLLRRVRAVRDDLTANGLYPGFASSRQEKPAALMAPAVEECEEAIPQLLSAIARDAVGRWALVPLAERPREGTGTHGT
ncbi:MULTISPECIES: L-tyrosine 3-hydroxylase [Streptomyces]|uniref:L-tyrosine 3-hydroxylase n=1 Tax=Streptomyces TaxID=1883 RepID=UPI00202262C0|nr:L-tyrosine 3-hydroxylase [Streptomyces sp. MCA2]MCL7496235.1 L-tyrosine 3-hydroxylase [Streptomyces sp. MCA2]